MESGIALGMAKSQIVERTPTLSAEVKRQYELGGLLSSTNDRLQHVLDRLGFPFNPLDERKDEPSPCGELYMLDYATTQYAIQVDRLVHLVGSLEGALFE